MLRCNSFSNLQVKLKYDSNETWFRLHENLDPTVSGTTADALVSWWNENSEKIFDILGDFARDLLSTGHKEPVEDTPASLPSFLYL